MKKSVFVVLFGLFANIAAAKIGAGGETIEAKLREHRNGFYVTITGHGAENGCAVALPDLVVNGTLAAAIEWMVLVEVLRQKKESYSCLRLLYILNKDGEYFNVCAEHVKCEAFAKYFQRLAGLTDNGKATLAVVAKAAEAAEAAKAAKAAKALEDAGVDLSDIFDNNVASAVTEYCSGATGGGDVLFQPFHFEFCSKGGLHVTQKTIPKVVPQEGN
jgi:hypothetical protein